LHEATSVAPVQRIALGAVSKTRLCVTVTVPEFAVKDAPTGAVLPIQVQRLKSA
jgi:hypothetical protein